jgi:hypothetical protein
MKKLETFRCHIKVRGEQCPCDLTLVNTFTYSLATLKAKSPEGLTLKTLEQHAICPWHARFLTHTRRDIFPMARTLEIVQKLVKAARKQERSQAYWNKQEARCENHVRARMPAMARAFKDAGISTSA